jgi:hypothetical protein
MFTLMFNTLILISSNNETGDFLLDKFKQLSSRVPNVDTNLIEGLENYPRR